MPIKIEEPQQIIDKKQQEFVVGIDFGTTNSLVSVVLNNQIKFLRDDFDKDIIPSIVSFEEDGKINVGKFDKNAINISSIKRLMGKSYEDAKNLGYDLNLSQKNGLTIAVNNKNYRPEEVASKILRYLKNLAQNALKKEINKCVLTVPAYFDEAAKNATKHAALLAGLEVIRLVNEPTAAAFAYGLDNKAEGLYLVYDLGGGTFDVSLLKMRQGVFQVLGVSGDNELGGDDFDREIIKKFPQLTKNEAKEIKEKLSNEDFVKIDNYNFSRQEFNSLIEDKIAKTISLACDLIDDLDVDKDDIMGIILVGGSTRTKLIQEKLAEVFLADKILTNLDPDRVVAMGAAWQAYNLSGRGDNLLLDVVPLSLGIEMMGGIVDKIITRNTATPCAYAKEFTTYADNQTGMQFHIVQGERELAVNCRSLANFEIKDIPAMKAGLAKILVTFRVDADGLLTVNAEEKNSGQRKEVTIKPTYSLSDSVIKNMLLDSLKNSKSDIEQRLLIEAINSAKKDIAIVKKDLEETPDIVDLDEKKIIMQKMQKLEQEINISNNKIAIEAATKSFHKATENMILQKVNRVLNVKISGQNIDEI